MKRRQEIQPADEPPQPPLTVMMGPTPSGASMMIQAMMMRLPPPGTVWPHHERGQWLQAMVQALSLIYREER